MRKTMLAASALAATMLAAGAGAQEKLKFAVFTPDAEMTHQIVMKPSVARVPAGLPGAGSPTIGRLTATIWMVTASIPLETYGADQLEPQLRDLQWVGRIAMAHEAVVEYFVRLRATAVIPMKLFTIFSSHQRAGIEMRRRQTLIGAMMIHRGDADGMVCGTFGTYGLHLHYVDQVLGRRTGVGGYAAMNAVLLPSRTVFIADTYVNPDPTAEQIAEIAVLCADEIRRFGLTPKIALLSHSSFGTSDYPSARKMREALALLHHRAPELEAEGEMHGDAALSETVRRAAFPNSRLEGDANLLIMPTLDAANISFNLLKVASGGGVTMGPILLGCAKPVHILTPSATVRRIVNMTALTVVDCAIERQAQLPY